MPTSANIVKNLPFGVSSSHSSVVSEKCSPSVSTPICATTTSPGATCQPCTSPGVYSLIGFDFIMRDFMMVLIGKSDANHVYPKMNADEKITFWAGKLFYFEIMFALPLLVFPWWQVLIGFMLVMLMAGLILGLIFQLAHINTDAMFPEPVGDPPHIVNEWAVHQVETTVDFAPHNRLLNWYIGGLNYQIEHHLLPHICHLNYPRLAPIVRATCEEFGIRYHCYPTWSEAFACHWRELRLIGRTPDVTRG